MINFKIICYLLGFYLKLMNNEAILHFSTVPHVARSSYLALTVGDTSGLFLVALERKCRRRVARDQQISMQNLQLESLKNYSSNREAA